MRKRDFVRQVSLAIGAEVWSVFMVPGEDVLGYRIGVYRGMCDQRVHVRVTRDAGQKDCEAFDAAMPDVKQMMRKRAARIEKDLEKIRRELAHG